MGGEYMGGEGLILARPPGILSADRLPRRGRFPLQPWSHVRTRFQWIKNLIWPARWNTEIWNGLSPAQPNLDFLKPHLQKFSGPNNVRQNSTKELEGLDAICGLLHDFGSDYSTLRFFASAHKIDIRRWAVGKRCPKP